MKGKTFVVVRWLLLVILLALFPQRVYACSCAEPGPPEEALADAVFAGKVVDLQFPVAPESSMDAVVATFVVSEVWKGGEARTQQVETPLSGASCGFFFQMDQTYVVYAYEDEGAYGVSLCGRTKLLEFAAEDLTALGEGAVPVSSAAFLPMVQGAPCEQSLADTLEENSGFDTLMQALEAAGLLTALEIGGPFTLFAPTDAAFEKLPSGALEQLLANPTGQLREILLFHIVPGRVELDELENGMSLVTQQGASMSVARDDCAVRVNGGRVLTPNIEARNGVIHAIDVVLLPPPE